MEAPVHVSATQRVLLCGDVHGDTGWILAVIAAAARVDARVVVLGDFGYWVHRRDGVEFLDAVDAAVTDAGADPLVFLDGNHEYHSTHPAKPAHKRFGLTELGVDDDGFVRVRPNVWFASRACRWVWSGVRFAALGGAASTDIDQRKRWRDWWPEETVRPTNVSRLGVAPLDVLLCHDAPAGHDVPNPATGDRSEDHRSNRNRELLAAAVAATRPRLVVHGHWHVRYGMDRVHPDGTVWRVEGLGANVAPDGESPGVFGDAVALLELPSLELGELPTGALPPA